MRYPSDQCPTSGTRQMLCGKRHMNTCSPSLQVEVGFSLYLPLARVVEVVDDHTQSPGSTHRLCHLRQETP
jgi:hypothetical protein